MLCCGTYSIRSLVFFFWIRSGVLLMDYFRFSDSLFLIMFLVLFWVIFWPLVFAPDRFGVVPDIQTKYPPPAGERNYRKSRGLSGHSQPCLVHILQRDRIRAVCAGYPRRRPSREPTSTDQQWSRAGIRNRSPCIIPKCGWVYAGMDGRSESFA